MSELLVMVVILGGAVATIAYVMALVAVTTAEHRPATAAPSVNVTVNLDGRRLDLGAGAEFPRLGQPVQSWPATTDASWRYIDGDDETPAPALLPDPRRPALGAGSASTWAPALRKREELYHDD